MIRVQRKLEQKVAYMFRRKPVTNSEKPLRAVKKQKNLEERGWHR